MVGIKGIWQSREANVLLLPGEEIYLIKNYDGDKTFLFIFAALHKHHQIVEMGICRAMQAGRRETGRAEDEEEAGWKGQYECEFFEYKEEYFFLI